MKLGRKLAVIFFFTGLLGLGYNFLIFYIKKEFNPFILTVSIFLILNCPAFFFLLDLEKMIKIRKNIFIIWIFISLVLSFGSVIFLLNSHRFIKSDFKKNIDNKKQEMIDKLYFEVDSDKVDINKTKNKIKKRIKKELDE